MAAGPFCETKIFANAGFRAIFGALTAQSCISAEIFASNVRPPGSIILLEDHEFLYTYLTVETFKHEPRNP